MSPVTAAPVAAPTVPARIGFRTDIQGLRGLAVTLVVLDHVLGWPGGGFLGVDIFYVISGYLITSLLAREWQRTGSISLRGFYARRIRRILPAALLVLLVTVIAAYAVWFAPRANQTLLDALSAATFAANWHFLQIGTNYLQAQGAVSPVQHYWSLSIEEQFYAVWPAAVLLLASLLRSRRRAMIAVLAVLAVLSLAWAAYRTGSDPAAAYFDTGARAWELLAGAGLAFVGTASARIGPRARRLASAAGLLTIVATAGIVQSSWPVPFPWVVPAVAGAVVVIWADASFGRFGVLENAVAQWLGRVSYSLYLWHFPVLIILVSVAGATPVSILAALVLMLALSELSYRFVERGVLDSRFLARAGGTRNPRRLVPKDAAFGAVALLAIAALSVVQLRGPDSLRNAGTLGLHLAVPHEVATSTAVSLAERRDGILQALRRTTWPAPVPGELNALYASQDGQAMGLKPPGCLNIVNQTTPTRICTMGDLSARTTVMVVGDSVAMSWVPTITALAATRGWKVVAVGFANCSLTEFESADHPGIPHFASWCDRRRAEMLRIVARYSPSMVVLSSSETAIDFTGVPLSAAGRVWARGTVGALLRLAAVPKVVVLGNPPASADPVACATRLGGPSSCVAPIAPEFRVKRDAERRAVADVAGLTDATYIDPSGWFCADGRCPAFVGTEVLKTDPWHLTEAAGISVAPLLAGVLPDP